MTATANSSLLVKRMSLVVLAIACCATPLVAIVNRRDFAEGDYYDAADDVEAASSAEQPSKQTFPWRQIQFISPSQELAQTRWWYDAPLSFSARGMDHLYLLNSFLLDLLQPPGLPDELLSDRLFTDPLPLLKENRAKVRAASLSARTSVHARLMHRFHSHSCSPSSGEWFSLPPSPSVSRL